MFFVFSSIFSFTPFSSSTYFPKDYEHLGRVFCETLMDFSDDNPNKVIKLKKTLKKMRKLERRKRRVGKQQSTTAAAAATAAATAAVDGNSKNL